MAVFLLTIEHTERLQNGIRLSPGMPLDDDRPEVGAMMQNSLLELRLTAMAYAVAKPRQARRPLARRLPYLPVSSLEQLQVSA